MSEKEFISDNKMGIGIITGVALGSIYGSATDDIAQSVGLGASLGIFIGAI